MYEVSTRLAVALSAYLELERPHVLRAEVETALRAAMCEVVDGRQDEAKMKPTFTLLHHAAAKLSRIQAGQNGPRTLEGAIRSTGRASARLRGIGL